MQNPSLQLQESIKSFCNLTLFESELGPDNQSTTPDSDYFIKTLSRIQSKGARPDLVASIITHYAPKHLPELSGPGHEPEPKPKSPRESITSSWAKKKLFIESLVEVLPPDKNSVPCGFLLRALRAACMVGVGPAHRAELEARVARQLDRAELEDLMIPCFGHEPGTMLLDFWLVVRVVKEFTGLDEARSGAALVKVSKLVDGYLAEVALDSNLGLSGFVELASLLPDHARASDDGLYRAIDTYLKAHPSLSKQDRKRLFNLIDARKLSTEASLHAAQNERLPVRAVIQVLLSEQYKISKHVIDWSGSLTGPRSPVIGLDGPVRCLSKREMATRNMEVRRLKDDVLRLQSQCMNMEKQIEKLLEKKKRFFSWKKLLY
ncbi:Phototropic-responsive NPH3 family protein [Striga hermonthica]|uniref:Phototropic-responsive NPH3 family protein n=1 Tax=Striga hermonthica TaxID=68872 RepID=A0A9N7NYV3_STRHE|nr:Phototropic-responsive NPH3 family protein [Striga hermonthica]